MDWSYCRYCGMTSCYIECYTLPDCDWIRRVIRVQNELLVKNITDFRSLARPNLPFTSCLMDKHWTIKLMFAQSGLL